MPITGLSFLLFALAAVVLYYLFPKRLRQYILLAASILFYLTYGVRMAGYLAATILLTYLFGLWLDRLAAFRPAAETKEERKRQKRANDRKKRRVLALSLVLNFASLALLKYGGFLAAAVNSMLGTELPLPHFLLPLGISFYIFQTSAYLIDISRGKHRAERSFLRYALFVCYFPQLVQGPINRFADLQPQLTAGNDFSWDNIQHGFLRMLYGVLKKAMIADTLAPIVAKIYGGYAAYPGIICFLGAALYCIQLYCDFSGGIDLMMGISRLFGISMQENFCRPYFSVSLSDFWRRWHISLGAWMRDYLFYPFALTRPMQRFGKWATSHWGKHFGRVLPAAVANLLVFAVVGIWHGPQAHYLAWGLYNGLVIALADLLEPAFKKLNTALHIPTESRGWHVFRIVRTFIIVNIGWYFDRNEFVQGCIYLRNTFTDFNLSALAANAPGAFAAVSGPAWGLVIISTLLVFAHSVLKEQGRDPYAEVQRLPLALRWGLYYLVIFMVLLSFICVNETVGFLYANF